MEQARDRMFSGEKINFTEVRPLVHMPCYQNQCLSRAAALPHPLTGPSGAPHGTEEPVQHPCAGGREGCHAGCQPCAGEDAHLQHSKQTNKGNNVKRNLRGTRLI